MAKSRTEIIQGDCLEVMKGMPDNSVHAVVCDPPYNLTSITKRFGKKGSAPAKEGSDGRFARLSKGFMGKSWDGTGLPMRPELWEEVWRVARPGAFLLAFGGTRTYHRIACAIEDAGWVIKDSLVWLYGSGFPKSKDISKAIDKKMGAEREVVGGKYNKGRAEAVGWGMNSAIDTDPITAPATDEAKQWEGWGTALKPSFEPIILAQKPPEGTYANNVLKWGCGGLNIDGCRISLDGEKIETTIRDTDKCSDGWSRPWMKDKTKDVKRQVSAYNAMKNKGRWPANTLFSHTIFCKRVGTKRVKGATAVRQNSGGNTFGGENKKPVMDDLGYADPDGKETVEAWECSEDCPVRLLDEQSGETKSVKRVSEDIDARASTWSLGRSGLTPRGHNDKGGASRFFKCFEPTRFQYCAKASRRERNAGLEESANSHPTVKPIALMRYLIRLVTPPNGTVFDPFTGSGTTGCAAALEARDFIGIEMESEYVEISEARVAHWSSKV